MSLFENPEYEWRETYFVFFEDGHRPDRDTVHAALTDLGGHLVLRDFKGNDEGFESGTVLAPDDFSAMDVVSISGAEVEEQLPELIKELRSTVTPDERDQLDRLSRCRCRLDIFHFQQHSFTFDPEGEPDCMDPGAVLLVLERLSELCDGVVVDPQSSNLM